MNKITLIFSDQKLEQKYQQSQVAAYKKGQGMSIPIIISLFQGTYWAIQGQMLLAVGYFAFSMLYSFVMYKIKIRGEWGDYVCYFTVSFTLSASIQQVVPQFLHLTLYETQWMEDITLLMGTQINSSHPILNALTLIVFFSIKIYLRSFSYLSIILILLAFQIWLRQYESTQNQRLQFLQKEKSFNSYNIYDDLIKDSLVILNYNQEWDRFSVGFTNQQFLREYSQEAIDFLRGLQISQHKMSVITYLHYKAIETKNYFSFEAFWKDKNKHIMIECWKYSTLDTQMILKFITKKSYSDNVYPLLYKGILRKLKKIDRHHYHTESLKNILAALLVRPQQLQVKIQPLNYRQLSSLMMNLLRDNTAIFSLNLKTDRFFTNVPLLYILMISLTKYYHASSFQLHQLDESRLEMILKGKAKQINESNKQFFRKLLEILVDLIRINSYQLEVFSFNCTIMNMEQSFKY